MRTPWKEKLASLCFCVVIPSQKKLVEVAVADAPSANFQIVKRGTPRDAIQDASLSEKCSLRMN
jgi:hypothetical protein